MSPEALTDKPDGSPTAESIGRLAELVEQGRLAQSAGFGVDLHADAGWRVFSFLKIETDAGIVPREQIENNAQYRPEMVGVNVPGNIYSQISGIDIVRAPDAQGNGEYYVLEDNLRVPSGVSYMLEDRKMMMRLFPALFNSHRVAPIAHYPDLLLETLRASCPASTAEPTVVPTAAPTQTPSEEPTTAPTAEPTVVPTAAPSAAPSAGPTAAPSSAPTEAEPQGECLEWVLGYSRESCTLTCSRVSRTCSFQYLQGVVSQEAFYQMVASATDLETSTATGAAETFCSQGINTYDFAPVPAAFTYVLCSPGGEREEQTYCNYPTSLSGLGGDCDTEYVYPPAQRFCPCTLGDCAPTCHEWVVGYSSESCTLTCSRMSGVCNHANLESIITQDAFYAMVAVATPLDAGCDTGGSADAFCTPRRRSCSRSSVGKK